MWNIFTYFICYIFTFSEQHLFNVCFKTILHSHGFHVCNKNQIIMNHTYIHSIFSRVCDTQFLFFISLILCTPSGFFVEIYTISLMLREIQFTNSSTYFYRGGTFQATKNIGSNLCDLLVCTFTCAKQEAVLTSFVEMESKVSAEQLHPLSDIFTW